MPRKTTTIPKTTATPVRRSKPMEPRPADPKPQKGPPDDPLDLANRTYRQYGRLLDMMEDPDNIQGMSIPQVIAGLKALLAYDLTAIRKYRTNDPDDAPGSAAKRYEAAFSNAGRQRAGSARRRAIADALADDDSED